MHATGCGGWVQEMGLEAHAARIVPAYMLPACSMHAACLHSCAHPCPTRLCPCAQHHAGHRACGAAGRRRGQRASFCRHGSPPAAAAAARHAAVIGCQPQPQQPWRLSAQLGGSRRQRRQQHHRALQPHRRQRARSQQQRARPQQQRPRPRRQRQRAWHKRWYVTAH